MEIFMNDIRLYEFIPEKRFPIILHDYVGENYDFPLHWHENIEIHYLFSGNGTLLCRGEETRLRKGDCAIVNGNELHKGCEGKCDYACIIFPVSFLGEERVLFPTLVQDLKVGEIFCKMYAALREHGAGYELEIKSHTYMLLAHLVKHHVKEHLSERLYDQWSDKLERINEAVRYMEEHFTEAVTTEELSRMIHLSEGYFCSLFKEVTGKTAKEYINSLRLTRAREILSSTDMTVTEAAFCCGFSDANYFTRLFKKETGISPREFRKREGDVKKVQIAKRRY